MSDCDLIYVILPCRKPSQQLREMCDYSLMNLNYKFISTFNEIEDLKNKKLLLCLELNNIGYDIEMINFLTKAYEKDKNCMENSLGAVLVHSCNESNTKRAAQDLIFTCNNMGCSFLGHPLVEATASLKNFATWKKTLKGSLNEICMEMSLRLILRLLSTSTIESNASKVTVLYSTPNEISNTLTLWHMTKQRLSMNNINEIQIDNGDVQDCKGCSYKTCVHFSKNNSCFYGGVITENVLPAVETTDILILLCPNYNDAVAANLTAVINRLTVLYHKISFHNKYIFSIIVSGNSGSDSLARQLIGALNINKGFRLPPYAFLMETANDPGAILQIESIGNKASLFASKINNLIKGSE